MAIVNKDFKVKSGLIVEGSNATVNGYDVLTKATDDQNYIIGLIGGSATSEATPDSVVLRDENADFSANMITSDLTGDVTGTVSDISNHTTSDLTEGTNKYFTDQRALDATDAAYDHAGDADQALVDAKAYTDGRETAITTAYQTYATNKAADAQDNAEAYADGLVGQEITDRNAAIATAKSQAISDANDYADGLAVNYDAAGDAAQALLDAKSYVDGLAVNYDAAGAAATAETNAKAYTDQEVAALVDGAPALLDTLNELAAAIADNPNYATDVANLVAGKQDTLTTGNGIIIDEDLIYIPTSIGSGISVTPSTVEIDRDVVDEWYDAAGAASSAQTAAETFATNAANNAQSAAEDYADGLAVNYDAAGSASAAQTAAQSYADGLAINYDAAGAAGTAEDNANTYTDNAINALSTDDIEEGENNLYYTESRANGALVDFLTNPVLTDTTNMGISYSGGVLRFEAENGVADSTTDDLQEGDNNLYFTDERAIDAVSQVVIWPEAVVFNNLAKQVAATTTVATASAVTAYSWAKADYRTAKFLVKTAYGTHTDVAEVLLTLDSSDNIAITEYAMVGTNGVAMSVSADVVDTDVRLRVTTVNNNSTVTVVGTLLA